MPQNNSDDDDEEEDDPSASTSNPLLSQSTFETMRIKLYCRGDCGSKLIKLLLQETNLRYLKQKSPRRLNLSHVVLGNAPRKFYQTLSFRSKTNEKIFISTARMDCTTSAERKHGKLDIQ